MASEVLATRKVKRPETRAPATRAHRAAQGSLNRWSSRRSLVLLEGNTTAGVLGSGKAVGMLDGLPNVADLVDAITPTPGRYRSS